MATLPGCSTTTRSEIPFPHAANMTTGANTLIRANVSLIILGYPRCVAFDRRTLIQTGLAMESTRSRTAPRSYSLQVLDQSAAVVALGARPVVVGAHASCDLVLADPQVSRRHAELAITTEGIRIKDLGSTNGTWYQGTRVTEVVVSPGSTIKFGGTPVRIAAADAPSL